jgi:diguanylate cyclase (GGDEF)-like protein
MPTPEGIDRAGEGEAADRLIPERLAKPEDLDAVTGLYVRRILDEDFPAFLRVSREQAAPLTCLMLDLDSFKGLNDTYGHAKGDEVLRLVAEQLQLATRSKGLAYRYGGEEFIALLANHTAAEGLAVAERIRRAVQGLQIEAIDRSVTVSIGLAAYPAVATTPADLIAVADKALYRAKTEGRNRVVVYPATESTSSAPR